MAAGGAQNGAPTEQGTPVGSEYSTAGGGGPAAQSAARLLEGLNAKVNIKSQASICGLSLDIMPLFPSQHRFTKLDKARIVPSPLERAASLKTRPGQTQT